MTLLRIAFSIFILIALALYVGMARGGRAGTGSSWTQSTFEDFRGGTFLDAGSNLYVSAKGRIQMISRWDLNGDGNLDIVLPSGHGHTEKENTYIYLNTGKDIDGRLRIELPSGGARAGLVADLNKDGFSDLVVVNNADSHVTRVSTWIFYGAKEGLSPDNRVELPAYSGTLAAAGDFNGDGWLDLAIACQWQEGGDEGSKKPAMSFIYWNSPGGFRSDIRQPLSFEGRGADAVAAGDLDRDGKSDLVAEAGGKTYVLYSSRQAFDRPEVRVVLPVGGRAVAIGNLNADQHKDLAVCTAKGVALIFGSETGFDVSRTVVLNVESPSGVSLADVDGDGLDEVVVSNYSSAGGGQWADSYVFYSDKGSFASLEPLRLPTLGASAVSVADLNGDGFPEIVFSNQNVTNLNSLCSYVYWNDKGRFRFGNHSQLATQGARGNAIGDINNDRLPDVIFFNYDGGLSDGAAVSSIYWGEGTRNFSKDRRTGFLTGHIFGLGQADMDDDGFADLIFAQEIFSAGISHNQGGLILYWGGARGFSSPTNLTMTTAYGGVRIADINRDGYLDLVAGGISPDLQHPEKRGFPIFWGSAKGFQHQNQTLIHCEADNANGVRGPLLMDLNRDGWLDLCGQVERGKVRLWWGRPDGFSDTRYSEIDLGETIELMYIEGADFNRDGWLDLLMPRRGSPDGTETYSYIYYGSPDGFSKARREEISSYVPYQNSIADLDKDGWLDIVLTSYGGEVSGNRPALIYWGGTGGFSKKPRTLLPTYGSSGSMTADFDGDGWIDILFANHRRSNPTILPLPYRHTTESMLYWGGPRGFSATNRWEVEAVGPSGLNLRGVGNSYDRGLYEDFISSAHAIAQGESPARISWKAETPHRTAVRFQVRVAESEASLESAPWRGPDGPDSWYTSSGSTLRGLSGSWIQYKARLSTPNGGATPYLEAVTITFQ